MPQSYLLQPNCLIIEPAGIIAAEIEDELRSAFNARIKHRGLGSVGVEERGHSTRKTRANSQRKAEAIASECWNRVDPAQNPHEHFDIVVLDCPISLPALVATMEQLRHQAQAFIFTHTLDVPFDSFAQGTLWRKVSKPYRMEALLEVVSDLLTKLEPKVAHPDLKAAA